MNAAKDTTILMYHDVSDDRGSRFREFVVTPEAFAQQMDHLASLGVRVCGISELAEAREEGSAEPMVAVTFDDAFRDLLANAVPVLCRHGFGATIYAPTAYLGSTSRWLDDIGEGDRPILSVSELREVASAGIECGSHSHTHAKLDVLDDDAVRREVELSKQLLEDALGSEVRSFAYPFGYEVATTRRLVAAAGYSTACRVNYARSGPDEDVYGLSRVPVTGQAKLEAFAALVDGRRSLAARRALSVAWRRLRRSVAAVQRGVAHD
jgi:peptidoglycan/xylan/chitin deacetylase (PgdA/CDA1 family)